MKAFVARENIKRFKAQLRSTEDEEQKVTLRRLLEEEQLHLQQVIEARHTGAEAARTAPALQRRDAGLRRGSAPPAWSSGLRDGFPPFGD